MPRLPALDDFPYIPQEEDSLECVPACVEMVCEFLGVSKPREVIDEELDYSVDQGTPFDNLLLLSGLHAVWIESLAEVALELEAGLPVIANLRTHDPRVLGYPGDMLHAVVVVGIEEGSVLFFDPLSQSQLSTCGPSTCDRAAFEGAWLAGFVLVPQP